MCMVLMVLEVILVVLGVVLVILHGAQRQCSEQMFGTDSVRNNVPSQLSLWTGTYRPYLLCRESYHLGSHFGTILSPFGDGLGVLKMVFLCLLYTSPSPRDGLLSRMPSSA